MTMHRLPPLALVLLFGCAAPTGNAPPAVASPGSAGADHATLDGKTYDVTLELPDGTAVKDNLLFTGGKFQSTACTSLGFAPWSEYVARAGSDGMVFHVLAKNPSGVTMDWNGKVQGDAVGGTAERATNGKTDVLRFKGSLRP